MCEVMSLEHQKQVMQKFPCLLAKGLTRADMAHVLTIIIKKYDKTFAEVLSSVSSPSTGKVKEELCMSLESDLIETQYEIHNGKFYGQMKEHILSNMSSRSLKERMQECFNAYENNKYYVCACGLLPLLERVLVDSKTSLKYNWVQLENNLKTTFKSYFNHDVEKNMEEYTIRIIVRMLAQVVDFDKSEPEDFNRHWLLHGRAERIPNKADCLKLFNIIELIIDIKLQHGQYIL